VLDLVREVRWTQYNSLDVIFLIVLGDWDVCPSWLQVDGNHLTKALFDGGECLIDDISDVVLAVMVNVSTSSSKSPGDY
jgi:hypothetical protein